MNTENRSAISNLLFKFANSFDLKAWDEMERCLAEQVDCDYSGLRGTKETLRAKDYVALRKAALEPLQTQHLFSNLEIDVSDDRHEPTCRCSAFILRRRGEQFFNTHAIYEFTCVQKNEQWFISKIKQTVLWNEGDTAIHAGVTSHAITKEHSK